MGQEGYLIRTGVGFDVDRRSGDSAVGFIEGIAETMNTSMMKKSVKAPKGFHWMKKGNSYKLMKGAYKPHKGAVKTAKFMVQKRHSA